MNLKPTHKAIQSYHATLAQFGDQKIHHELAVRSAFQTLLADTARDHVEFEACFGMWSVCIWTFPDGLLRNEFSIPRGFWEAKDTHGDLDAEIRDKITSGYPTSNIIFDDTQHAVLYQDGREVLRFDVASSAEIAEFIKPFLIRHYVNARKYH